MPAPTLRDRLRAQLADLKMPGALEALDDILRRADSGELAAGEAMSALLGSHIALRNQRRLQTAMRAARLPAVPLRSPSRTVVTWSTSLSRALRSGPTSPVDGP